MTNGIFKDEALERKGQWDWYYKSTAGIAKFKECSMVRREVMASNLNDFLGLDLVPLTTLKRGLKSEGVGVGSEQKFVSDAEFGSKGEQRVSQELHRLAGSAKSSAALDKNKPYLEYEQRLLDACFLLTKVSGASDTLYTTQSTTRSSRP